MVNNLGFRWPKRLFFMVLMVYTHQYLVFSLQNTSNQRFWKNPFFAASVTGASHGETEPRARSRQPARGQKFTFPWCFCWFTLQENEKTSPTQTRKAGTFGMTHKVRGERKGIWKISRCREGNQPVLTLIPQDDPYQLHNRHNLSELKKNQKSFQTNNDFILIILINFSAIKTRGHLGLNNVS